MTFLEFIRDEAPKKCGVHPSFGKIAEMVFFEELKGVAWSSSEAFYTARERAALALPYNPEDFKEYDKCLDIIEFAIIKHRLEKHNELKEVARFDYLSQSLSNEEQAVTSDWWNF